MKIVFLDAGTLYDVPNLDTLKEFGELELHQNSDYIQTIERCQSATIVITNKVIVDKNVMDKSPNLKLICVAATGMNNIDLEYAKLKQIKVMNVTGYSTQSVAQITWAMILNLVNHIQHYDRFVKSGLYAQHQFFTHIDKSFYQLYGKTVGIIGLGSIGREVAQIGTAFGMKVIYASLSGVYRKEIYEEKSLKQLLQTSDIVSIHSPLNDKSKNIIDYSNLQLMKKSAFLINAGRGGIVVEHDIAKALNENLISGYATDVYEKEPIIENNPMLSVNDKSKLLLLPHIAWASIEARTLLVEKIAENIRKFLYSN
ncbi:MAG: D-2-hydroxyacid dehydrogenase [Bacteroidota bacterium]|nr:D-2-hydroxyacid dehydrogenase [Bacteroidota bacterium]